MDDFDKRFYKELLLFIGSALLVVALLIWIVAMGEEKSCYAKWDDAEVQSRWSFFGGCQIRMQDGRWIPEERYVNMKEIK